MNDNPPEVAADEEVIVCESSRPGQVSPRISVSLSSHLRRQAMKAVHAPGLGSQLFPSVWVDSSELSGETQRSPLKTV